MEEVPRPENLESRIRGSIEKLAKQEGINPEDIESDIDAFMELSEADEDAGVYFEELAEKLGIRLDEILTYARKRNDAQE